MNVNVSRSTAKSYLMYYISGESLAQVHQRRQTSGPSGVKLRKDYERSSHQSYKENTATLGLMQWKPFIEIQSIKKSKECFPIAVPSNKKKLSLERQEQPKASSTLPTPNPSSPCSLPNGIFSY